MSASGEHKKGRWAGQGRWAVKGGKAWSIDVTALTPATNRNREVLVEGKFQYS